MDRSIPMLLIGLVFGGGLGFTVAAANGIALDAHDHDHGDPAQHGAGTTHAAHEGMTAAGDGAAAHSGGHAHDMPLVLPAGPDAPSVSIAVAQDPASGWNLQILPQNFRFSPENASLGHVSGEGHAHVYINGEKLARVYGSWMHLASLPAGEVEITVSLNSNDHRPLEVSGALVEARTLVSN